MPEVRSVPVENPDHLNVIIGQTHFIKTAEDLYEAIVNSVPQAKFGVAFCEASGPCLVRVEGNDPALRDLAARNALAIGAGHTFVVFLRDAYPLNVLRAIRDTPEVVTIFCATSNPLDVLVSENPRGRGIVGVIDGERPKGIETEADRKARREFLRKLGYKLG
jgi:adenosine/AMP kinase